MDSTNQLSTAWDVCFGFHGDDKMILHSMRNMLLKERPSLRIWPSDLDTDEWRNPDAAARSVIGCRLFVPILSKSSLEDRICTDLLSLAYVSNKSIIPLGLQRVNRLVPSMIPGIKLIVSTIHWSFAVKEETRAEDLQTFCNVIFSDLQSEDTGADTVVPEPDSHDAHGFAFYTKHVHGGGEGQIGEDCDEAAHTEEDFWSKHFGIVDSVLWSDFKEKFESEYSQRIVADFGEDKLTWMCRLVYKDVFLKRQVVQKAEYDSFRGDSGAFYTSVKDYAAGSLAMKDVFDMNSTVRLTVVQNMGKFQSFAVIMKLMKMLKDEDPNIRAVSALALGKCNEASHRHQMIIDKLLDILDSHHAKDRLVRESVVLALGKLRAEQAVAKLGHLWRNDPIRDVREASQIALDKIGGSDVERMQKITHKLGDEINYLRKVQSLAVV